MSVFGKLLGRSEITREAPEAIGGVNTNIASIPVTAVLGGEDRGEPITNIEDYSQVHKIGTFEEAYGYYLDGSS